MNDLQKALQESGRSLAKVAEAAGIGETTIRSIYRGDSSPRPDTAARIMAAINGEPIPERKVCKIRELRLAHGLTQAKLAKKVGVSEHTIRKWEAGDAKPLRGALANLAKALGVEPTEIAPPKPRRISIEERNEIVTEYIDFAASMISHMGSAVHASGIEKEDLMQELMERIIKAVDSYDPSRGTTLKGHIYRAARFEIITETVKARNKGMTDVPKGWNPTFFSIEAMATAGLEIA